MEKKDNYVDFLQAKDQCVDNLKSLQTALQECVDDKRVEMEDSLYDQLIVRLNGASLIESWEELGMLIDQSKILEEEIAAWLSIHGLTSYSLFWPKNRRASN
jgi:hypothetical protein